MQLKSDFTDYYDECFDGKGLTFARFKKSRFSRKDCFDILENCGFTVPMHGVVADLVLLLFEEKQTENLKVVVYTNNYRHDKNSLVIIDGKEAYSRYGSYYGAEFLICDEPQATTYTYLKIGKKDFGLTLISNNEESYYSNQDGSHRVQISCCGEGSEYHPKIKHPVFSIDYIRSKGRLYAIDFTVAPCLRDLQIEVLMQAKEVYEEICSASEIAVATNK